MDRIPGVQGEIVTLHYVTCQDCGTAVSRIGSTRTTLEHVILACGWLYGDGYGWTCPACLPPALTETPATSNKPSNTAGGTD